MTSHTVRTRILLLALAALLGLPTAATDFPAAAKSRTKTVTRTVGNTAPITLPSGLNIPSPASASNRYPSEIAVSGLRGTIRDVNVRLRGLTHTVPYDVQVLLVGPGGQTAVVMAGVGDDESVTSVTLTLDDEAAALLSEDDALQSGIFRPTNAKEEPVEFNAPAPISSSSAALSVFDGTNPNGTWRLFVQDEFGPEGPGGFSGGWEIELKVQGKAKKRR